MPAKKLPDTDEERLKVLNAILAYEELLKERKEETILSVKELHDFRRLLLSYESDRFCFAQALEDESKANKQYMDLYKNAQLYIFHFIQVLNLSIIRNEIKQESRTYYGIKDEMLPDLSTGKAVLEWGERLIKGEAKRLSYGDSPIYNPAISKVKMHYELFKDAFQSLKTCRSHVSRMQKALHKLRDEADRVILNIWTKVEFKYWGLPSAERQQKFEKYGIRFYPRAGEQLNVFG